MLALWALSPRNIRLVSAVPSTVVVDNQDPRIQYTPAEQWSVPLFNVAPLLILYQVSGPLQQLAGQSLQWIAHLDLRRLGNIPLLR